MILFYFTKNLTRIFKIKELKKQHQKNVHFVIFVNGLTNAIMNGLKNEMLIRF